MAVTQRSLALVLMSSRRIGSVLRTMREAKGLTQAGLGRRAKVTNIYSSMLEPSKTKDPSLAVLTRIAKAVGVPLTDLLG